MIDVTPTPTNEEAFNGRRHTNKYVSVLLGGLSCSLHIQFFSQNQSLLSLIQNQIIKKKSDTKIKNNNDDDDDNSTIASAPTIAKQLTRRQQ